MVREERKTASIAVVFDMDGVLFDTERLITDCWMQLAKEEGLLRMQEVMETCIGTNTADTIQILKKEYGENFDVAFFLEKTSFLFHQFIKEHGVPVKKGVYELLSYLKQEEIPTALASSTKEKSVLSHLEQTKIRSYFKVIVCGDMVKHSKPDPEIYCRACEGLGVLPKDVYAVEDSFHGITSAYRAGIKPIMVPDLIKPTEEIRTLTTAVFSDLLEVKEFFSELIKKEGERK